MAATNAGSCRTTRIRPAPRTWSRGSPPPMPTLPFYPPLPRLMCVGVSTGTRRGFQHSNGAGVLHQVTAEDLERHERPAPVRRGGVLCWSGGEPHRRHLLYPVPPNHGFSFHCCAPATLYMYCCSAVSDESSFHCCAPATITYCRSAVSDDTRVGRQHFVPMAPGLRRPLPPLQRRA